MKFLENLTLFGALVNEHLCKVYHKEMVVYNLGKIIQNEFIQLHKNSIEKKILAKANLAEYLSIILCAMPDVSLVGQNVDTRELHERLERALKKML